MLREHNHKDLPKSAKSLLKTPRSTKNILKKLCEGSYWYGGIVEGLKSRLHCNDLSKTHGQHITIDIFVDGISPRKKVKEHVVVIAGCVALQKRPFVIALWTGRTRDTVDIHKFFEDFIAEAKVMINDGFVLHDVFCKLVVRRYIGDTPAREWMLQVVFFNAYFGCERCTCKGVHICERMTFPIEDALVAILRTNESVGNQEHGNHHKGISPFLQLGANLVSDFPLEPMHLVFLGCFRRVFSMLLNPKEKCTLKKNSKDKLSEYLFSLKPYIPSELEAPRPIEDWRQFKAAEWKRLGVYDSFLLFKFLLSDQQVPHRRSLNKLIILIACSIRILSDPDLLLRFRSEADIMLRRFVKKATELFGQTFTVFNVHSLIHLTAETVLHGTLDSFSAWNYESYLANVKKMLRAPGRTLEQVVCRLMEQRALPPERIQPKEAGLSQPHNKGPTFELCDQFKALSLPGAIFRASSCNDICFISKSDEVCVVRNIIRTSRGIFLVCNVFLEKSDFFTHPISSQLLGICVVKVLAAALKVYPIDAISRKAVLLPLHQTDVRTKPPVQWMKDVECVCLPMLHTVN